MSFLKNYLYYGSGHDCPEPFMIWSALSLVGALAGRKIWTTHGTYFTIYPNIYVTMVGTPGSGKSTAMSQAEDIFVKYFPNYMISESIQSREHILKVMTNDECIKTWKDEQGFVGDKGNIYSYRPFYAIVDEMENFVSVDQKNMVGMLVGIYSRNSFGTGFKNDTNTKQRIDKPYFSLLGCTTPEWMMSSLRASLFVGGLGRRMIIVHCKKEKESANPTKPPGADEALIKAVQHLQEIEAFYGPMKKTEAAEKYWLSWFNNPKRKNKEDPILIQFHETKPIQVLKIAMLLALCEAPLKHEIDAPHLEMAVHLLDSLEKDVVRLTSGIGRNELAGVGSQIIEFLERTQGLASEVSLKKYFNRYMRDPEFAEVMKHYLDTEQLFYLRYSVDGIERYVYMLPETYQQYIKKKASS